MPQPNIQQMLKQAQEMMAAQQEAQDKLKDERVEASAGGGMVKVVVTGDLKVQELTIDPSARTLTAGRKWSAKELSSFTFRIWPGGPRLSGKARRKMSPKGCRLASFHSTITDRSLAFTATRGKAWPLPRL